MRIRTIINLLIFLCLLSFHAENSYANERKSQAYVLQNIINPPENSDDKNTWIGGDVGTSIKLSSTKYLWLFGDTFLGTVSHQSRHVSKILHNTVAITTCKSDDTNCQTTKKNVY